MNGGTNCENIELKIWIYTTLGNYKKKVRSNTWNMYRNIFIKYSCLWEILCSYAIISCIMSFPPLGLFAHPLVKLHLLDYICNAYRDCSMGHSRKYERGMGWSRIQEMQNTLYSILFPSNFKWKCTFAPVSFVCICLHLNRQHIAHQL